VKIVIKEEQYKFLVESSRLWPTGEMDIDVETLPNSPVVPGGNPFTRFLSNTVPEVVEWFRKLEMDELDKASLSYLSRTNIKLFIKGFNLFQKYNSKAKYKQVSGEPNITPLPTSSIYTGSDGIINSYYQAKRFGRKHHGVDLNTQGDVNRQPIVATCSGVVTQSKYGVGACGGMVTMMCDGGKFVQYCHLGYVIPARVIRGVSVPQGFPLGISGGEGHVDGEGKAGRSSGAHLHYSILDGSGNSLNPHNLYPKLFPGPTTPKSMSGGPKGH